MDDPFESGDQWAQRQEGTFEAWIHRYGRLAGDDPLLWDFGIDSLDRLSYIVFHHISIEQLLNPADTTFADGAAWYLGEIVRRSDPKRQRWALRDYGMHAGDYVVEPTAKSRAAEAVAPHAHLRIALTDGNPQYLRAWYADYVAPLWDKPWPAWTHETNLGDWTWDSTTVRWVCQRDQWVDSIAPLITQLAAALPSTPLDYSTTSLQYVEAFLLDSAGPIHSCATRSPHTSVNAYCAAPAAGGRGTTARTTSPPGSQSSTAQGRPSTPPRSMCWPTPRGGATATPSPGSTARPWLIEKPRADRATRSDVSAHPASTLQRRPPLPKRGPTRPANASTSGPPAMEPGTCGTSRVRPSTHSPR